MKLTLEQLQMQRKLQQEREKAKSGPRKHWLWSNASIERFDAVLKKYGVFRKEAKK